MTTRKTNTKPEPKTVKMVRDAEVYLEPHTADVHPDEVENMKSGGWTEA